PLVEALEYAEHPLARVARDPDARVGHADREVGTIRARPQSHSPTRRRELDRVRQEVEEDLSRAGLVDEDARTVRRLGLEGDPLRLSGRSRRGADRLEQQLELDHL